MNKLSRKPHLPAKPPGQPDSLLLLITKVQELQDENFVLTNKLNVLGEKFAGVVEANTQLKNDLFLCEQERNEFKSKCEEHQKIIKRLVKGVKTGATLMVGGDSKATNGSFTEKKRKEPPGGSATSKAQKKSKSTQ